MTYKIEVSSLLICDTREEADALVQALRALVKNPNEVRLYSRGEGDTGFKVVPNVEPMDRSLVTRGRQEKTALAGNLTKKLQAAFNATITVPVVLVGQDWVIDHATVLAAVQTFDNGEQVYRDLVTSVAPGEQF